MLGEVKLAAGMTESGQDQNQRDFCSGNFFFTVRQMRAQKIQQSQALAELPSF
jgi:hypothetical protein